MQSLVRVAEHEIQEKLKPLLDKAEVNIAQFVVHHPKLFILVVMAIKMKWLCWLCDVEVKYWETCLNRQEDYF